MEGEPKTEWISEQCHSCKKYTAQKIISKPKIGLKTQCQECKKKWFKVGIRFSRKFDTQKKAEGYSKMINFRTIRNETLINNITTNKYKPRKKRPKKKDLKEM